MKKLIFISILVLIFAGLSSCDKDFLNRAPILEESEELVLSNFDGINAATAGLYAAFYSGNWYGAQLPIITDLKGDNGKSSPKSSGRYQQNYNWNQDASQTMIGLWSAAYVSITSASNVINAAPDAVLRPGETQSMIDQCVAEALFIRALAHFDLVRVFAQPYTHTTTGLGVPVITTTRISQPERNTIQEVYDQIEKDLLEAVGLFASNTTTFYNTYRPGYADLRAYASVDAVNALLARVYLYKGDYVKASTYATKVIDSPSNYALYTAANYVSSWGVNAASEVVFEVFGSTGNSFWPSWEEIGYLYDPNGSYGDVCATNALLSLYEATDVRRDIYKTHASYPGYFWPSFKYPGKDGNTRQNNIPVFRLSEMYLIRAEAALNGAAGDALADYNAIRTKRGLTAAGAVTMDDIFDERRRELAFEGHILFDYARLKKTLVREDEDNRLTGPLTISFPSYLWAMPIPIQEMEANPNMVQNEGY